MPRVGNVWFTEDGWIFHHDDKELIVAELAKDDFDIVQMEKLNLDYDKYLKEEPNDRTLNYAWYKEMVDDYFLCWAKFKVPVIYQMGIKKFSKFALLKYKDDTAYFDRMGGVTVFILLNDAVWKKCRTKQDKKDFIDGIYLWWQENDKRERTHGWISKVFEIALKKYETHSFVEQSFNWMIDWIIKHKKRFVLHENYLPEKWYGSQFGDGHINIKVHGRDY